MIHAAFKLAQMLESRGLDYEIFLEQGRMNSIGYRDRSGIIAHSWEFQGLGLRVILESRMGFSSTTHPDTIQESLEAAIKSARVSDPDPARRIPCPDRNYPDPALRYDPKIEDLSLESGLELLERIMDSAKLDPSIKIQSSEIEYGSQIIMLINSHGIQIQDKLTTISGCIDLGIPPQVSSFESQSSRALSKFDPEWIGENAARIALEQMGSQLPPTLDLELILMPRALQQLLEYITLPQLCGDRIISGDSPYIGKLGSQISSQVISLRDDGCLEAGMGSMKFDGEGIPMRSKYLIKSGVLLNFLHDSYTAAKLQSHPTGNASRGFDSLPEPWITNLVMDPGDWKFQELLQESRAILVRDVIGAHTSSASGEFCLGLHNPVLINRGESVPLKRLGIAGNMVELLAHSDAVAKDHASCLGRYVLFPIRFQPGRGFKYFIQ